MKNLNYKDMELISLNVAGWNCDLMKNGETD